MGIKMKLICVIPLFFLVTSCASLNRVMNKYPDSFIEQRVEDTIEDLTGMSIDFTKEDSK